MPFGLTPRSKGDLLALAAMEFAAGRAAVRSAIDTEIASTEWLRDIAENTYPKGNVVSDLFEQVTEYELDWEYGVFPDGKLDFILCMGDELSGRADGMLEAYGDLKKSVYNGHELPTAAEGLGIHLSRQRYENWVDGKLVFDEDEFHDAVNDACVQLIEGFLSKWRNDFFRRVLESPSQT